MNLKRSLAALALLAVVPVAIAAENSPPSAILGASLQGTDGQVHHVDDWRGKVRIVNFWATWCAPCRSELPLLEAARAKWHGKGVEVIGVAVDQASEVKDFLASGPVHFPILVAEQGGQALMRAGGNTYASLPFTLLIGPDGQVLQRHMGVLDERILRQWLEQAAISTQTKDHT